MAVSELETILISDVITFILSAVVSLIGFAVKWGSLNAEVRQMKATMVTKDEMTSIRESLSEIKGMFVLRLRDKD
jgi:sensor domain CHASE-containing protein